MKLEIEYVEGATRIDEDELADLIPDLTTRRELDEFEAMSIAQAQIWLSRRPANWTILDSQNCKQLHKRMFGEVWRWSGQNRKTAKNIGVESYRIETELRRLIDDVTFWIANQTYEEEEIIRSVPP